MLLSNVFEEPVAWKAGTRRGAQCRGTAVGTNTIAPLLFTDRQTDRPETDIQTDRLHTDKTDRHITDRQTDRHNVNINRE